MLILGRKHKFNQKELKTLEKKFTNIDIIKYRDKQEEEVLKDLISHVTTNNYSYIVLNTAATVPSSIINYLTKIQFESSNLKIITIETFMEKFLQKCYIPSVHVDLRFLEDIQEYSTLNFFLKRIIDYIFAISMILLSSPILYICRKKIKQQSPGPIFFKQLRLGYKNKEFECIKFRSMKIDAEKEGIKFASKNDDRVFAFGETMRKLRFDELPQLINVLKGQMHLIGPRPERKFWTSQFEKTIPYYNERHLVKPGITGWAQVMYPYGANEEDAKQKLMYDLYYIKHWSIRLELKIIYKTALVVLGKKGI